MNLLLRQRVIAAAGIALAMVFGWQIAQGSVGWAALVGSAGLLLAANMWLGVAPDTLIACAVLLGYLVGNRGFAQLHVPNLPLLPAEAALGLALACGLWRWAREKRLPLQRDSLNIAILAWVGVSAARLPMDFRHHGIMALRDFAMVYYALFFFLAQDWARDETNRRWLGRSLSLGLALAPVAFFAFLQWPDMLISRLAVMGVPLIYVKGDVAGGFMAAGGLWFAQRFARSGRRAWLIPAGIALLGVALSNSRAALVGLFVGLLWLIVLRLWRPLAGIGVLLLIGLMFLAGQAAFTRNPWTATPLYRLYETVASVTDFRGARVYQRADLGDKPDNNQFRLVWWRTVMAETWVESRWLGLGFGHDLASEFLRVYYADANEDFSARSPHNYLLSVFGRTGLAGLAAMLVIIGALAGRTFAAGRAAADAAAQLRCWLAGWTVLTSACFGVVLEGPMGAVVFWTLLGLANAPISTRAEAADLAGDEAPPLRPAKPLAEAAGPT